MKQTNTESVPVMCTATSVYFDIERQQSVIFVNDLSSRLSSFHRLVRTFAWIRRFIDNCRTPKGKRLSDKLHSPEKIEQAKAELIRLAQMEHFHDVLEFTRTGRPLPQRHRLNKLTLNTDRFGCIIVQSRVRQPQSSDHPVSLILLSPKSKVTLLLLRTLLRTWRPRRSRHHDLSSRSHLLCSWSLKQTQENQQDVRSMSESVCSPPITQHGTSPNTGLLLLLHSPSREWTSLVHSPLESVTPGNQF